MADNMISKIKLGGAIYHLKDEEARSAVANLETVLASSLVFKGVVSNAEGITSLTNYQTGWTYKANSIFIIEDLGVVEPGDMIICINGAKTYSVNDWTIVQNNVDIMTGAATAAAGTKGLVPAPAISDVKNFLRGDGTWGLPSLDELGVNTEYIILNCGSSTEVI